MDSKIIKLSLEILNKVTDNERYIVGIAGIPGSGKSTLAENLSHCINEIDRQEISIALPMDGFHLHNDILEQMNLRSLKGIPQTFDGEGFIDLLAKVKNVTDENVGWPDFDRTIDNPRQNAIIVKPTHKIVIVEGNYLLLDIEPWIESGLYLDETLYLDHPWDEELHGWLLKRHMDGGMTEKQAREKVIFTDYANTCLIMPTMYFADKIIQF